MEVTTTLQGSVQQQNASVASDGQDRFLRATRAGQLLTADWKTELVLAGYAFNVTVGSVTLGGDVSLITGGGNGTTINSDRPEMAVGTPAGYYHIPMRFTATIQADHDADGDVGNIILFADVTQQIPLPIAASCTPETPINLLDDVTASVSRVASAYHTADITDPVSSIVLAYATNQAAQVNGTATAISQLQCDYDPSYPTILAGPCSVVACWGGTAAVTGACSYFWAEVPASRFA